MQVRKTLFVAIVLLPGCASMQDCHYEATNAWRTQWAWYHAAPSVRRAFCPDDFGRGWKQGYYAVTIGGTCDPPSFPPTHYWSAHYQSPAGQAAIAAWYRGYQSGAIMAERRGAGNFHYLHPHGAGAPAAAIYHPPVIQPAPPHAAPESIPPGEAPIGQPHASRGNRETEAVAKAAEPNSATALAGRVPQAPPPVKQHGASMATEAVASATPVAARIQPARAAVKHNVAAAAVEAAASTMPADYFQEPPVALEQPESMLLPDRPAMHQAAVPSASHIEKSSWTAPQAAAPAKASSETVWSITRLPAVLPPLFNAPPAVKKK